MTDREIGLVLEGRKTEHRKPICLKKITHPVDCIVWHDLPRGDREPGWYACQLGGTGDGREGPRRVWQETLIPKPIMPGDVCVIPEPIVLRLGLNAKGHGGKWPYRIWYPCAGRWLKVKNWQDMPDDARAVWDNKGKRLCGKLARDWMYPIRVQVVDVKVERLHDISRGGLIREGCMAEDFRDFGRLAGFDERWNRELMHAYWKDNPWCFVFRFFLHEVKRHINWEPTRGTHK